MPKPIDDTEMLAAMAEDIVAGRAETPTGAMRLHGVERGSGQERRLLKKWKVCGAVALATMCRFERMRDDAMVEGFNLGQQAERDARNARDAEMIAATSAFAQPEAAQAAAAQNRPSFWQRLIGVAG